MNEQSPKWKLNVQDVKKWINNTLVFLAPVALIYLGVVASRLQDGIQGIDFVLTPEVQGMIALYIVNIALDFFRKLNKGPETK